MSMQSPNTSRRADELRFDAGAPWLDLLATVGNAYGAVPVERLTDLGRLEQWLARQALSPRCPLEESDLARAHALRATLRPLGLAAAVHTSVSAEHLDALNAVLAADEPLRLTATRQRLAVDPPATADAALARIARNAAETLCGPAVEHLRTCGDPDCAMLFLDPGGRRRWCSAQLCGVKHRVRAHRARRTSGDPLRRTQ